MLWAQELSNSTLLFNDLPCWLWRILQDRFRMFSIDHILLLQLPSSHVNLESFLGQPWQDHFICTLFAWISCCWVALSLLCSWLMQKSLARRTRCPYSLIRNLNTARSIDYQWVLQGTMCYLINDFFLWCLSTLWVHQFLCLIDMIKSHSRFVIVLNLDFNARLGHWWWHRLFVQSLVGISLSIAMALTRITWQSFVLIMHLDVSSTLAYVLGLLLLQSFAELKDVQRIRSLLKSLDFLLFKDKRVPDLNDFEVVFKTCI